MKYRTYFLINRCSPASSFHCNKCKNGKLIDGYQDIASVKIVVEIINLISMQVISSQQQQLLKHLFINHYEAYQIILEDILKREFRIV